MPKFLYTLLNRRVVALWILNVLGFGIEKEKQVKATGFKGTECKFYMNIKMMHLSNSLNVETEFFGLYASIWLLFSF